MCSMGTFKKCHFLYDTFIFTRSVFDFASQFKPAEVSIEAFSDPKQNSRLNVSLSNFVQSMSYGHSNQVMFSYALIKGAAHVGTTVETQRRFLRLSEPTESVLP